MVARCISLDTTHTFAASSFAACPFPAACPPFLDVSAPTRFPISPSALLPPKRVLIPPPLELPLRCCFSNRRRVFSSAASAALPPPLTIGILFSPSFFPSLLSLSLSPSLSLVVGVPPSIASLSLSSPVCPEAPTASCARVNPKVLLDFVVLRQACLSCRILRKKLRMNISN